MGWSGVNMEERKDGKVKEKKDRGIRQENEACRSVRWRNGNAEVWKKGTGYTR